MRHRKITIAIDGPAASGKSTTARRVARKLNYVYIDTGAMYRAVTLAALHNNIPVDDTEQMGTLAASIDIELHQNDSDTEIFLDGTDVSRDIRLPEVTQNISPVAANARVREILVAKQQQLGKNGGVVMDGRDIGTVVFPEAELKIFMEASVEERARRRIRELRERGVVMEIGVVESEIRQRDEADQNRDHGPLRKAPDAISIDTTTLSIDEQVAKIVLLARRIISSPSP